MPAYYEKRRFVLWAPFTFLGALHRGDMLLLLPSLGASDTLLPRIRLSLLSHRLNFGIQALS